MKKRILIFSLAYYPSHVSGAEVAIKEITDRIDVTDIEFHLITLRFERNDLSEEKIGNVMVYRVGKSGSYVSKTLFPITAALKACSLHKQYSFSAAWAMMTYMLLPVVVLRLLGVRIPHILTLQDGDPYERVFKRIHILPFLPFLNWGFRSARVIQVISTYLATWPTKRGFQGKVILIPNGASLPSAQEYPREELEELKRQVGKREDEIFLVSVSRLVHQKAIDTIIRALPLLPSHIRLLVVGDGEERENLKALARELGVLERTIFAGNVDRTMTAKYRKISDIFVLPSRSEGQGISFLSTMVSGLPIIATQEGGIADFLFDSKRNPDKETTGWAVDKDSPEQIAEAVKDILAHPEKARKVTETAKQLALEKYDWDSIARAMRENVFKPTLTL